MAEVNYLLWGMINKLAWDANIYPAVTNYVSASMLAYSQWSAITSYEYDENDRLLKEMLDDLTAANNDRTTTYQYDHTQQTGKMVTENGILVSETTFEYDLQGRMAVVELTTSDGVETTSYAYDANGIRTASIHEKDGVVTRTEYLNDSLSLTGYVPVHRLTDDLKTETETPKPRQKWTTKLITVQTRRKKARNNGQILWPARTFIAGKRSLTSR